MSPLRTYLAGVLPISEALEAGAPLRVLLVASADLSSEVVDLVERAERAGLRIWKGSPGDLRRMSRSQEIPTAIAMLGPSPHVDLEGLLSRGGLTWLVHRAAYPSNVGFVVRTAEVSGADGVIIDALWNHQERGRVDHVSMGASLVMPVLFHDSQTVFERAQALHVPIIAIEDVGTRLPWQIDLRGPALCMIGGERHGIDPAFLPRCDHVVHVPMAGFVPSYNLQAAMTAVAIERLRQLS